MASLSQRVGLLEQQVSLFSALMAQTLSGRWTGEDTSGELPFAAADLVALLGGQQAADQIGFEPVSFSRGVGAINDLAHLQEHWLQRVLA